MTCTTMHASDTAVADTIKLDDITVTAIKQTERTASATAVTTITGDVAERNGVTSVKSAAKLVPGDILLFPGRHTAVVVESDNPFTYKLSYKNAKGKSVSVQIEEDTDVRLNPNNGTEPMSIKMDSDKNLAEIHVSLTNHDLNGWTRTGDRDFTACYRPKRAQLKITAEKVKI